MFRLLGVRDLYRNIGVTHIHTFIISIAAINILFFCTSFWFSLTPNLQIRATQLLSLFAPAMSASLVVALLLLVHHSRHLSAMLFIDDPTPWLEPPNWHSFSRFPLLPPTDLFPSSFLHIFFSLVLFFNPPVLFFIVAAQFDSTWYDPLLSVFHSFTFTWVILAVGTTSMNFQHWFIHCAISYDLYLTEKLFRYVQSTLNVFIF